MGRQTKITIEEEFISQNAEERQQKFNKILLQIINKSEIHKIA
jgi:hypothetical protein